MFFYITVIELFTRKREKSFRRFISKFTKMLKIFFQWKSISLQKISKITEKNFCFDFKMMLDEKISENVFFRFQSVFLFSVIKYKPLTYKGTYEYPGWALAIGWLMAASSIFAIPFHMVFYIVRSVILNKEGTLQEVRPFPNYFNKFSKLFKNHISGKS